MSRALGLRLTSQLALLTGAEQGMRSAKAGGRREFMFPGCRDGSDADSAVTSVCVAHKCVERAHPAGKRVQVSLKKSSFFFLKTRKKLE